MIITIKDYGLTEIYLRFAIQILTLMMARSR
jgi:hypothetical protein